ncbi:putative phage tail protein [Saccharibacillus endophyticus]|uniref:DUF2313 domain-containing protein n=1 Tax=Saccharibacillus endophyticus TaxID=2060666 RepID=A0ABQ1ZTW0_9BACL|nr:putative phage tail protein [Saccharibacillus endophyticus]GGH76145.1 hypothetical protein GCM10007362_17950 [Saccharibacillus endophyticus]
MSEVVKDTVKGVSTLHAVNVDGLPLSEKGQELFSYLPYYYETSRIMRADAETKGREMDLLHQALEETRDQFFVRTATWGLDIWERELDIAVDPVKPIEQRRSVVESKLRGGGVFSGKMVRNVAAAYERGTVDVTFRPEEWAFTIHFVDTIGLPPNLDDLKAAIEAIKPAHLAVEYEFSYLLIRDVHGVMTLGQLDRTTLDKFAFN